MGIAGGTLMNGWKGVLLKQWTFSGRINAASGYPLTPIYPSAITGTGVTGPVRPDHTGADVEAAPPGLHLNPAAYTAPASGHWGNAGRNSIPGPTQFGFNASLARTFRTSDRTSLDLRVDMNNVLNHVTFPSWDTTVGSAQFGLPLTANAMRNVQTTVRWRF
jgi:trimeric autotransporter adhesin